MSAKKKALGVFGFGAAACAACCAGPIVGLLVATGLLTAGGLAAFGAIGLIVAIPGVLLIVRHRTRRTTCSAPSGPVMVAPPLRRRETVPAPDPDSDAATR